MQSIIKASTLESEFENQLIPETQTYEKGCWPYQIYAKNL
jgi:hypothetical protein